MTGVVGARGSIAERLWSRVDGSNTDGCWMWTGGKAEGGYGKIWVDGRLQSAHRVAYELRHGAIPADRFVLHRCDNPSCVNPDHLFLGTHLGNMADMRSKQRQNNGLSDRTHCPQGHPYSGANLYVHRGKRYCRACQHARQMAREKHPKDKA